MDAMGHHDGGWNAMTGSLERLFLLSRALLRFSTPRFDGINHFAADTSSTSE